jgi:hypothetical protein
MIKKKNDKAHFLKIDIDLFIEVKERRKTFEIRRDDIGFQVGDTLIIYPYDRVLNERVGDDECRRIVTHILPGGQHGVEHGFVILSIN